MTFAKPFFVFALTAFIISPAMADDGKKVSYSLKKQGRVHFQESPKDTIAHSKDTYKGINPADIEPAAGDITPTTPKNQSALSNTLHLPRKN